LVQAAGVEPAEVFDDGERERELGAGLSIPVRDELGLKEST